MMICRRVQPLPVEVIVRGYLSGSGWKDYQRTGAVCGIRLPDRPARERPAAGAALHALDQGRGRPRREHRLRADGRPGRAGRSPSARGTSRCGCTAFGRCTRRAGWHHPGRHQVRAGHHSRRGGRRAGDDAAARAGRLILIDEVMTPDSSRFWDAADVAAGPGPALVRQAVRARLARAARRGTRRRRARSCPTRWSPAPAPATWPPSSASPGQLRSATSARTSIAS